MWWEDVCHRDRLDDPRPRRFGSLECTDSLNFSQQFLTKINYYYYPPSSHSSSTMNPLSSLPNESSYTLATVHHPDTDEFTSLLSPSSLPLYGSAPVHPPHHARRVVFKATCKMALIFTLSCIFLGGTLWIALPTLEPYVYFLLCLPGIFTPAFVPKRGPHLAAYTKVICSPSGSQLPPQEIQGYPPFPRLPLLCAHLPLVSSLFCPSTFLVLITFLASKHSHYRDRCTFPSLVAQYGACPAPCL